MIKVKQQLLRTVSRRFWGVVFTCLIAIAVLVQLGRQAFPLLEDYQKEISGYFGDKLGVSIELESLEATWSGLRPKLILSEVHMRSRSGDSVFKVANVALELSLINSIRDRRISWRQLIFDGFETTLVQSDKGVWSIQGMPVFIKDESKKTENIQFNDPYDIFLLGRRIKISRAQFSLNYYSGTKTSLQIPAISIDNDRNFHRINASLDVDQGEKAFNMIIEGHGDPRNSDFIANVFLELKNFPTFDVLDALAMSPVRQNVDQKLNLKLWLRSNAQKGAELSGELSALGSLNFEVGNFSFPKELTTKFYGNIQADRTWSVTLTQLVAKWEKEVTPDTSLSLYGDFRRFGGLRIPSMDVGAWSQLALKVGLGSTRVEDIVAKINPRGIMRNIDVAVTDKERGYFQLSAFVEKGQSNAIMGAPAFKNVNGYLSTNLKGGTFDVDVEDGFEMALPKVYHDPLQFDRADGQVRWKIDFDKKMTYLSSGLLTVTNPEEEGKGYFSLSIPFSKKYGEQILTLSIGIKNTLAINHKKYLPKTVPKELYRWIGSSIKDGKISNARFLYRGTVEKNSQVSPSIQLYGNVADGEIKFDENWPVLMGVHGGLRLNDRELDIRINSASILGNEIYDAEVKLLGGKGFPSQALAINGRLEGDASDAMALMQNSPIKQAIGSTFDSWKASGTTATKVDLIVPLKPGDPGLSNKIEIDFKNADLNLESLSINIDKIFGKLYYDTEKGLYAKQLKGAIWERPFKSKISSSNNSLGGMDTTIEFEGDVSVESLYEWTSQPVLRFASGVSKVSGEIYVPGEGIQSPIEVRTSSDLKGVTLNLPHPLAKPADQPVDFGGRIQLFNFAEQYQFTLGDKIRMTLLSAKNSALSAQIDVANFDKDSDDMPRIANTGVFDINGNVDIFDLKKWKDVKDRYLKYFLESLDGEVDESAPIHAKFELTIDKFLLGSFEIDEMSLQGERVSSYWNINVGSNLMAGKVLIPENDQAITLNLDYLRFDTDEEDEPTASQIGAKNGSITSSREEPSNIKASVLADIDLAELTALDFSTRELSLGGVNYGNWNVELRPIDNGIAIRNIGATGGGLVVGSEDQGAEFVWTNVDGVHYSRFKGQVWAGNLAEVFESFDQEKLMESESASIEIDARWPGAPDQATLKTLAGVIAIDIRNGSFSRGAGSDENGFLRLLALFNFDTILRRLKLDFSDLAAQGYSYDKIYGSFDFTDGKVFLTEPLIVDSSSSYVQLVGTIDLIKETLDSEMVVTLPVASNIAVATAIIAGLPAALGVYVMSKLFKKQVDRASSLNVDVTGKWSDPKVKIRKIFDLDAATRRGKEIEKQKNTTVPDKP